jgi:hypothetical protein
MNTAPKFIARLVIALAAVVPLAPSSQAKAASASAIKTSSVSASRFSVSFQAQAAGASATKTNPFFTKSKGRRDSFRTTSKTAIVNPEQAKALFRKMAAQRDIAFHFPVDGCYARAHLMVRRMMRMGFHPGKVWTFALKGQTLRVRTRFVAGRKYVNWGYHVAPTLRVRYPSGKVYLMVIDPSMFRAPVTVSRWVNAQKPNLSSRIWVSRTRFGQAPTGPDGKRKAGSGYWPGINPRRGPDAHALAVMNYFKPYEGRLAPKWVLNMPKKLAV